ncbi:MAG: hydroxyacid dehydrogenase [Alphaproteobacteria bacterium]|nr:hydroxyacid dehydrogenase [Alphaproteobacteria bacterium]
MSQTDKPLLILDQHFRTRDELFHPDDYRELLSLCNVIGGADRPMERSMLEALLPRAAFLVAAHPRLSRGDLVTAGNLKAIIEVSGTFRTGLDYEYCFDRGVEVLSCAPGFQFSVAEMTLGLLLSGARGIVSEHENFRKGQENWLGENAGSDFTLYNQDIGFIGFGAIARETARLLAPFSPRIKAYDPWLSESGFDDPSVQFCNLDRLVASSRCIVVAAAPTDENFQLLGTNAIRKMKPGTLVIVISRSHLVDFEALIAAAHDQHIRVATDVFPQEPVLPDDAVRQLDNIILSPHRAAAVEGGRHPIGRMIVHDIRNTLDGTSGRHLQPATPARIHNIIRAPMIAETGAQ